MNALIRFSVLEINPILLQSTSSSFPMNLVLYLLTAVVLLTLVVLIYIYNVLQAIWKVNGLYAHQDFMTVDWVKVLYVATISLGLISSYIYWKLI